LVAKLSRKGAQKKGRVLGLLDRTRDETKRGVMVPAALGGSGGDSWQAFRTNPSRGDGGCTIEKKKRSKRVGLPKLRQKKKKKGFCWGVVIGGKVFEGISDAEKGKGLVVRSSMRGWNGKKLSPGKKD